MIERRKFLALATLAGAAVALPTVAQTKTLHMVVGYPPGGITDSLARMVARLMGEALGMTAVVDNMGGASGSIGARNVMRAAPDGLTLNLCTNQHATNAVLQINAYDPLKDFTNIAGLADIQQVLVVRKGLPVSTVAELVAYAKTRPGQLNYASTGNGAGAHLAMELFKQTTGTDLLHVPFKGGALMTQEILAGRIDATFATVPSVLGHVETGSLRALAIASDRPSPHLPDVPLLKDSGVEGCEADSWLGLIGPAGMAPHLVEQYNRIIRQSFARADVREAAFNMGLVVNLRDSKQFNDYIASEIRKWGGVVRAADIHIDQ